MALSKLVFKPGINRDQTDYASEGGWYSMDKVRFRSGFPEKIGGWIVSSFNEYIGTARAIYPWVALDGGKPFAIGTNEKQYIQAGTTLFDITPIRITFNHSSSPSTDNCLTITNGSNVVTVTLTGHGATEGSYVTFSGIAGTGSPAKLNGIPISELNAEFKISNVDANTFDITVTTLATSNGVGVGGTSIVAEFQINIGNVNVAQGYGWGAGGWGTNPARGWGAGSDVPVNEPAQLTFFQNFNSDLIYNIRDSYIYYWVYNTSSVSRAVLLSSIAGAESVPQQVGQIILQSNGFLFALGCTAYDPLAPGPDYTGDYDPLLVRWSNVDADIGPQPEYWTPTVTNTAGFFRLQAGTRIVSSINTRQELLVWTDTALYSLQYLGTVEVFGQQQLSAHVSIAGPNVVAGANNITYWMGNDKFYIYSGRVDTLPCTLRQYIFQDINRTQSPLFFAGTNVQYNEIIWFYCSASSNEIDRYVIYNFGEDLWYYGQLHRTTWIDTGISYYPTATANGWVYSHEYGTDDGQPNGDPPNPMESYIQSADIDITDGEHFMLVRRVIPDVNFGGSETSNPVTGEAITPEATMTVGVRNFPGAAIATENVEGQSTAKNVVTSTATIDQYTNQVFIRARGRQMNFKISSDTVGTQWQLGMPRVDARPDGTRG